MGRTARIAARPSYAGVQQARWSVVRSHWLGLPKKTGSSGQCFVIGRSSLVCDSDKERRKEVCGQGDMHITKEREYVTCVTTC